MSLDTKALRVVTGIGRDILEQRIAILCDALDQATEEGICLGWYCPPPCSTFSGCVKERLDACRACEAPRSLATRVVVELCRPRACARTREGSGESTQTGGT